MLIILRSRSRERRRSRDRDTHRRDRSRDRRDRKPRSRSRERVPFRGKGRSWSKSPIRLVSALVLGFYAVLWWICDYPSVFQGEKEGLHTRGKRCSYCILHAAVSTYSAQGLGRIFLICWKGEIFPGALSMLLLESD